MTGAAVPVAEKIAIDPTEGIGLFALAAGTLAFVDGEPLRLPVTSVVRLDREGKAVRLPLPSGAYFNPRLSPDGKRLAMVQFFGLRSAVVIYDPERDIVSTLTPERGRFFCPVWSPDGQRLAFSRMGATRPTLSFKNADGSGEIQTFQNGSEDAEFPSSFAPDGKTIAYTINYSTDRGGTRKPLTEDIWLKPVDQSTKAPIGPWFETPFREAAPAFSPDAKWVAYVSNESGAREIYVRPYPGPGAATKVSPDSGSEPAWTRGGRELIYRTGERYERFMMVEVAKGLPTFSSPRLLFTAEVNIGGQWSGRGSREEAFRDYDVSADGNAFYATQFVPLEEPPRQLVVVTDWAATVPR